MASPDLQSPVRFPKIGRAHDEVIAQLKEMSSHDADWRGGHLFGYVYNPGWEAARVVEDAHQLYVHSNALSVSAFPSLRRMEGELLAMTAELLSGPGCVGALTSGGTESILMTMLAAREWARREGRPSPAEVIAPVSAHPAFDKAAFFLGLKLVRTPLGADLRADVQAIREAITPATAMLVASSPGFPHGVIDPIESIAALAQERGLLCHVDACLGGFMLPFLESLGVELPLFDFRVPGVTSMSADLHKYGYAAKGVSCVLYRSAELRRGQFFATTDWPGGVYASPTAAGARGGAPIASAWAAIQFLGEEGFVTLAGEALRATRRIQDAIRSQPGLRILGNPPMTVFAFTSDDGDIYALGDALDARGWHLDRQQLPPSLHLSVSPRHAGIAARFATDLSDAHDAIRGQPPPDSGLAALYGMMGALPDRSSLKDFALSFLESSDAAA
jgi:glutamate/tyrosine decarboxylase-like PLP-dependent enzyme